MIRQNTESKFLVPFLSSTKTHFTLSTEQNYDISSGQTSYIHVHIQSIGLLFLMVCGLYRKWVHFEPINHGFLSHFLV